jgi:hypothetical protein
MSIKHKLLKRLLGVVLLLDIFPILIGITDDRNKTGKTFIERYITVIQFEFVVVAAAVVIASVVFLIVWCFGGFEYEYVDDSLPA